jgi:hypothetical protein
MDFIQLNLKETNIIATIGLLYKGKAIPLFVLLTQYCAGDKIEKNEMGRACGTYGGGEGGV